MPPRPILPAGLMSRPTMALAFRPAPTASTRSFTASSRDNADDYTGNSSSSSTGPTKRNETATSPLTLPVPPESPNYIKVHMPPQSEPIDKTIPKGHLPVPRNVFEHRKSYMPSKLGPNGEPPVQKSDTDKWAAAAAPPSAASLRGDPPKNEKDAWRRRLAETRRESLATGLKGLWNRHETRVQRERARKTNLMNRNRRAALSQHERLDDVLSRSSVREVTVKQTMVIRDPERHEKQAAMAERTAALAAAKRDARRDALMELYQAAGNFIVDEDHLRKKVADLFRPDFFKDAGYKYGTVNAENVWDMMGQPSNTADMVSGAVRTESKLYHSRRTEVDRTTKRQKQVAEVLTGGKMVA